MQEIHNTMRMSQELTKHSIWLHRMNNKDTEETESCPIRQENKRRLNLLLNELKVGILFQTLDNSGSLKHRHSGRRRGFSSKKCYYEYIISYISFRGFSYYVFGVDFL